METAEQKGAPGTSRLSPSSLRRGWDFFRLHLRRPSSSLGPYRGEDRTRKVGGEAGVVGQVCEAASGVLTRAPQPAFWGGGRGGACGWRCDGLGVRRVRLLKHILSLPLLVFSPPFAPPSLGIL